MYSEIWLAEAKIPIGTKHYLIKSFESIKAAYEGTTKDYKNRGLDDQSILKLQEAKSEQILEKQFKRCEQLNIKLISMEHSNYPKSLKEIVDAPIVLYVKGNLEILNKPALAIVGARKCSEYGYEVAKKFGRELAQLGINVVSGMAQGIDEATHYGALEAGATTAVLGTGVDQCYPSKNRNLYDKILQKGCIISEYAPGTMGLPFHFPMRNRIISGLSIGVIVVEAEKKSGSLITANLALEQNREVFAVPGNIQSALSYGANKLIQAGAKMVITTEDIIEEYPKKVFTGLKSYEDRIENNQPIVLDKVENMVYDCLSWQPMQIESIQKEVSLSMQTLEMILLQLEFKGLVKRLPAKRYSRMK